MKRELNHERKAAQQQGMLHGRGNEFDIYRSRRMITALPLDASMACMDTNFEAASGTSDPLSCSLQQDGHGAVAGDIYSSASSEGQ